MITEIFEHNSIALGADTLMKSFVKQPYVEGEIFCVYDEKSSLIRTRYV